MVKQGDIIKINFDPAIANEHAGYRPAVVVSNNFVLSKTNIVTICPITTKQQKTALNVMLDGRTHTQGVVLCAHNKAVDINKRAYKIVEQLPEDKLTEVVNTLISMLEPIAEN